MTETPATEDPNAPAEQPDRQPAAEQTDTPEAERDDKPPGAEAARYRRRLRDTEADRDTIATERDTLAATVDGYQRRDTERAAEQAGMTRGADLWDAGGNVTDFLADDGTVDPDRVQTAVDRVLGERPHWRRRAGGDVGQGVRGAQVETSGGWGDVLRGA